ncbi:MAG: DUF1360 domain-containing protein [Candidatus Paceibacteria bacterium]
MQKRIDWWDVFFSLLFIFLVYLAYRILVSSGTTPQSVSMWDAFLMMLATFRLTRLIVYDSITRWFRDFFEDGKPYTFLGTLKTLINCPWCMGLWFAVVVAGAYFYAPFLWFFIFVLALSGAATFVQLGANWVGWSTEYQKRKVLND